MPPAVRAPREGPTALGKDGAALMEIEMNDAFRVPSHVIAREVGEETVILDLEKGVYLSLDSTGARIWNLMSDGETVRGICAAMLEEYEVASEVLERDVLNLLSELAAKDLILPAA